MPRPAHALLTRALAAVMLATLGTAATAGAQQASPAGAASGPLRLAVARLTHTHVHMVFARPEREDMRVVGIWEPDTVVARKYAEQYKLDKALFFPSLEALLDRAKPEAVAAFGSIREHLGVVEAAAPRGVHVMVEKPLAVSLDHAQRIAALARRHRIHVLTNYETTWYPSTHAAYEVVHQAGAIGPLRKIVVHDGHPGPKEIGVPAEFLAWLTDPVENGAGALTDFGCYGANLVTWLMKGAAPVSVTAVTQQVKPDVYPKVDDEATIVLAYPKAQAIVQASWNWPASRKDMEVYGRTGYVMTPDARTVRLRTSEQEAERTLVPAPRPAAHADPFALLRGVVRGSITLDDADLSALPNNVTVVRILDAAKESARTGRTVRLGPAR